MPASRVAVTFAVIALFALVFVPYRSIQAADVCTAESQAGQGIVTNDCVVCITEANGLKRPVGAQCTLTEGGKETKANCLADRQENPGTCEVHYCFGGKCFDADLKERPDNGDPVPQTTAALENLRDDLLKQDVPVTPISQVPQGPTSDDIFKELEKSLLEQSSPPSAYSQLQQMFEKESSTFGETGEPAAPFVGEHLDDEARRLEAESTQENTKESPASQVLAGDDTFRTEKERELQAESNLWETTKSAASEMYEYVKDGAKELAGDVKEWANKGKDLAVDTWNDLLGTAPVDTKSTPEEPPGIKPTGPSKTVVASTYGWDAESGDSSKQRLAAPGTETLDKHPYTFAQKTGAFGERYMFTYTDPKTGESTSVVAERLDRGPYVAGREVDVDRITAQQLGLGKSVGTLTMTPVSADTPLGPVSGLPANQVVGTFEPNLTNLPGPIFTADTVPASWTQLEVASLPENLPSPTADTLYPGGNNPEAWSFVKNDELLYAQQAAYEARLAAAEADVPIAAPTIPVTREDLPPPTDWSRVTAIADEYRTLGNEWAITPESQAVVASEEERARWDAISSAWEGSTALSAKQNQTLREFTSDLDRLEYLENNVGPEAAQAYRDTLQELRLADRTAQAENETLAYEGWHAFLADNPDLYAQQVAYEARVAAAQTDASEPVRVGEVTRGPDLPPPVEVDWNKLAFNEALGFTPDTESPKNITTAEDTRTLVNAYPDNNVITDEDARTLADAYPDNNVITDEEAKTLVAAYSDITPVDAFGHLPSDAHPQQPIDFGQPSTADLARQAVADLKGQIRELGDSLSNVQNGEKIDSDVMLQKINSLQTTLQEADIITAKLEDEVGGLTAKNQSDLVQARVSLDALSKELGDVKSFAEKIPFGRDVLVTTFLQSQGDKITQDISDAQRYANAWSNAILSPLIESNLTFAPEPDFPADATDVPAPESGTVVATDKVETSRPTAEDLFPGGDNPDAWSFVKNDELLYVTPDPDFTTEAAGVPPQTPDAPAPTADSFFPGDDDKLAWDQVAFDDKLYVGAGPDFTEEAATVRTSPTEVVENDGLDVPRSPIAGEPPEDRSTKWFYDPNTLTGKSGIDGLVKELPQTKDLSPQAQAQWADAARRFLAQNPDALQKFSPDAYVRNGDIFFRKSSGELNTAAFDDARFSSVVNSREKVYLVPALGGESGVNDFTKSFSGTPIQPATGFQPTTGENTVTDVPLPRPRPTNVDTPISQGESGASPLTQAPSQTPQKPAAIEPYSKARSALTSLQNTVSSLGSKYNAGGTFTAAELQRAVSLAQQSVNAAQKIPDLYQQAKFQQFNQLIGIARGYIASGDMQSATQMLGRFAPNIVKEINTIKSGL